MLPRHARLLVLLAFTAACGGKVFVDTPGSTGSGGAGGVTTGGGGSCTTLLQDLTIAIQDAKECAPNANILQCDGSATVVDQCGCTIILNEHNAQAVSTATDAANAADAAGCIQGCGTPCPPVVADCLQDSNGTTGHCVQSLAL